MSGGRIWWCDYERCGENNGYFRCPCLRFDGLEDLVIECGPRFGCELECGHRLTRGGVLVLLKIVKERKKVWCVYCSQSIS